jgi:hypothetical protein
MNRKRDLYLLAEAYESVYKDQAAGAEASDTIAKPATPTDVEALAKTFGDPDYALNIPVSYKVQTADGAGTSYGGGVTLNSIIRRAQVGLSVSGSNPQDKQQILTQAANQLQDWAVGMNQDTGVPEEDRIDDNTRDYFMNIFSNLESTEKFINSFGQLSSSQNNQAFGGDEMGPQSAVGVGRKFKDLSGEEKTKVENKLQSEIEKYIAQNWDENLAVFKALSDNPDLLSVYQDVFKRDFGELLDTIYSDINEPGFVDDMYREFSAVDPNLAQRIYNNLQKLRNLQKQEIGTNLNYDKAVIDIVADISQEVKNIKNMGKSGEVLRDEQDSNLVNAKLAYLRKFQQKPPSDWTYAQIMSFLKMDETSGKSK